MSVLIFSEVSNGYQVHYFARGTQTWTRLLLSELEYQRFLELRGAT